MSPAVYALIVLGLVSAGWVGGAFVATMAAAAAMGKRESEEDDDRVADALAGGIYIGYTEDGDIGAWCGVPTEADEAFENGESLFDILERVEAHFTVPHGAPEPTGGEG
jgi:hypothetical protein